MEAGEIKRPVVVTIDGPAGAGKSTVARKVAMKLAFVHVNSGALYRAVGVLGARRGVSLEAGAALGEFAKALRFEFVVKPSGQTLLLVDGKDIQEELETESSGAIASKVALLPEVREALNNVQREAAKTQSIVVEGRDAGTVVFPNASFKFYLDASVEERARRRFEELRGKGSGCESSLDSVRGDISSRDNRDRTREIAPEKQADDAVRVDTTTLSIEEVVEKLVGLIERA